MIACSASVQMLQYGSELPSSLAELFSKATSGWRQKKRLQSLFIWSSSSIFLCEVLEPSKFCRLLSSYTPYPTSTLHHKGAAKSEGKPVVLNIRSFLLRTASNCVTSPYHLLTQICWGVLLSRHSADWMDLERHQELMWIKESKSCNQERKRKSIHQN